jgi:TP901 family phage tail tape measure protein
MANQETDFGRVADDLRRAAGSFALLTSSASAFGAALREFREFEKQITLTNAIAGGTVGTYKQMADAAREFSLITTTSAVEAGVALQQLAQAGFTAQESLQAMSGVLLLAQATLSDVATTSDVVSANIRAFGLTVGDTTRIANVFSAAITGSLATMDKLAFAMRQVAPVAELANLSIEETSAALGVLFNIGLRGEQAGTALRNIIIRLVRPLGEAGDKLIAAGIATKSATGEFRNLNDILKDIGNSNLTDSDLAIIFETEALAGVKAYIKALQELEANGISVYDNLLTGITGTDRAVELAAANLETLDASIKLLSNTMSDLQKEIGERAAPYIIAFSDAVRDLYEAFGDLDEGTQNQIVTIAAIGAAAIGSLAAINALMLLIGGPLIKVLTGSLALMGGLAQATVFATQAFFGMTVATGGMVGGIGAAITALGVFVHSLGAATLSAVGLSAAVAIPFLPIIVGVAAVATAIGGLLYLFDSAGTSAKELENALNIDTPEFLAERADIRTQADNILGKDLIDEISKRVDLLNRELELIGQDSALEQAGYAGRKEDSAKAVLKQAEDALKVLGEQFGVTEEYFEKEKAFNEAAQKFRDENDVEASFNLYNKYIVNRARSETLLEYIKDLSDREAAALAELSPDYERLVAERERAQQTLLDIQTRERDSIGAFLQEIVDGTTTIDDDYAYALSAIQASGKLNEEEFLKELALAIADPAGDAKLEDILRAALEATTDLDADVITDLLTIKEQKQTQEVLDAIRAIKSDLEADLAEIRVEILENELDKATNLSDALRLASEIGYLEMQANLQDLSDDLLADFGKIIKSYGIDLQDGIGDLLRDTLATTGYEDLFDIPPQFADIVSGKALNEAISGLINDNTSLADAERIIAEQTQIYQDIMDAYVAAAVEQGRATPEQGKEMLEAGSLAARRLLAEYLRGIGDTEALRTKARETIEKAAEKATREREKEAKALQKSIDDALKEAEEKVKQARALEDAFIDIQNSNYDLAEVIVEAGRGFGLATREAFAEQLDLTEIGNRYDQQIVELQRTIEDVKFNFTGSNEELALLTERYGKLITSIELARDAEIKAATSFTAQMERRSEALDLFIRDLTDAAYEAQGVYTQVGAGIVKGFAEYNKEVVTLVDIAADATTTLLDGIATSLSDAIWEAESFGDAMKAVFRDISKQSFAAFTKGFLQQGISSLTGGGGSMLGNGAMGSPNGNTELPGVGTGGLLGKMFPGLFGAVGQKQIPDALQSIADDAKMAGLDPVDAFRTSAQEIRAAGQEAAQALRDTAAAIRGGVGGAAGGAGPLSMGNSGTDGFGIADGLGYAGVGSANTGMIGGGASLGFTDSGAGKDIVGGIVETANALGISPRDLATVISYETAGSFDPLKNGPTTQWGQHKGLIQFGEPQAEQYGVDFSSSQAALDSQLGANGAIVKYLKDNGFEEGMGILDLYSTINAGAPGRYSASDANNGGTAGNVGDKVGRLEAEGHYAAADRVMGDYAAIQPAIEETTQTLQDYAQNELPYDLGQIVKPGEVGYAGTPPFNPTSPTVGYTGVASAALPQAGTAIAGGGGVTDLLGGAGGDVLGTGGTGNPALDAAYQQFQTTFQSFTTQITQTLNDFGTQFADALNNAIQAVNNAAGAAGTGAGIGFTGGGGGDLLGSANQLFQLANSIPGFDTGGKISGEGTGTSDSILARVSNGEFVVKAKQVSKYGDLLEAINNDELNGYASGGIIANGGFDHLRKDGGSSNGNSVDNSSVGDTIALTVNYMMNGGNSGGDSSFRRSASQNAKQIGRQLSRAKRNN